MRAAPWRMPGFSGLASIAILIAFAITCTGDDTHSVSSPLPAYLLPQQPYFLAVQAVFAPPNDVCNISNASDALLGQLWSTQSQNSSSKDATDFNSAIRLAHSAAIWGAPSVQVAAAFSRSALNPTSAFPSVAINEFVHDPNPHNTVGPAAQTGPQDPNQLHSIAWLDLRAGPQVVSLPDMGGRFFELQFVDVYNQNPLIISSLDSPLGPAQSGLLRYAIAYQTDNATAPSLSNYTFVSNSSLLWVIGKVHVRAGNATDLVAGQALQDGIAVAPLSRAKFGQPFLGTSARDLYRRGVVAAVQPYRLWGADRGPYTSKENFNAINETLPMYRNTSAFWELLGAVTALSPPQDPLQAALYASYSGIGLSERGWGFDPSNMTAGAVLGMEMGLTAGLTCIIGGAQARQEATQTSTRWERLAGAASFGYDYLGRAFSAFSALGVDPANMSISYLSRSATDRDEFSAGEVLDGGLYNYTIAFAQAPQASAGWSLTAYSKAGALFTGQMYNKTNYHERVSVGSDTEGLAASSGSFSIYISATPPDQTSAQFASWLPVGPEPFYLVLRLLGPPDSAQRGAYTPPPVYASRGGPQSPSLIKDVSSLSAVLSTRAKRSP